MVRQSDIMIIEDDLQGAEIIALLKRHLEHMREITPAESVFALDLEALRAPEITFWTAWENGQLMGCAALKNLGQQKGEIKSMRTDEQHLGKGVASQLLDHILEEARRRNYRRLLLETGSFDAFAPARALYEKYGFSYRGPFGVYQESPNNVFMELAL